MGPKCASEIILKKESCEASDHEKALLEKEQDYADLFANSYNAAQHGFAYEVIFPQDTGRKWI